MHLPSAQTVGDGGDSKAHAIQRDTGSDFYVAQIQLTGSNAQTYSIFQWSNVRDFPDSLDNSGEHLILPAFKHDSTGRVQWHRLVG